jgi:Zn-dependent protease
LDYSLVPIHFAVLLFSLSFHEAAHAWTADKFGDPTARYLGRITLNPIPHIDIFGTIVFPLVGMLTGAVMFGWAKPVPVNTLNMKNQRLGDIWVSLAGPLSNLILAIVFFTLLRFLFVRPLIDPAVFGSLASPLGSLLTVGLQLNVVLMIFNLLPIPPLDGSHVLRHALSGGAADIYDKVEAYGGILLLLLVFSGVTSIIIRPVIGLVSFFLYL